MKWVGGIETEKLNLSKEYREDSPIESIQRRILGKAISGDAAGWHLSQCSSCVLEGW